MTLSAAVSCAKTGASARRVLPTRRRSATRSPFSFVTNMPVCRGATLHSRTRSPGTALGSATASRRHPAHLAIGAAAATGATHPRNAIAGSSPTLPRLRRPRQRRSRRRPRLGSRHLYARPASGARGLHCVAVVWSTDKRQRPPGFQQEGVAWLFRLLPLDAARAQFAAGVRHRGRWAALMPGCESRERPMRMVSTPGLHV